MVARSQKVDTPLRVLFVASEAFPIVKTGGLGEVVGALPAALIGQGLDVRLMLPGYRGAVEQVEARGEPIPIGDPLGTGETRLIPGRMPDIGVPVWLVDCPGLYDRDGGPYLDTRGHDWADNDLRFALLARAADLLCGAVSPIDWRPDILHAHDWQAGLVPAYGRFGSGPRPPSVLTIHSIAFPGKFSADSLGRIGLPPHALSIDGVEFWGDISFLKAGIVYADRITTVSPTYARELLTPEFGQGFDGLLATRAADLSGILNGIDEHAWNPTADPAISSAYDAAHLAGKRPNREALAAEFGLDGSGSGPLLGLVSRLTAQKGIDLILAALPRMLAAGASLAVLGTGVPELEEALRSIVAHHAGRVGVTIGYDEKAAHRIQAGCDALLVPSRFEPCGLTQLCALRYGTLPIVRRTGGLADTVIDAADGANGTGFVFEATSADALADAVERAAAEFRNQQSWQRLQKRAMAQDYNWRRSATAYAEMYAGMLGRAVAA